MKFSLKRYVKIIYNWVSRHSAGMYLLFSLLFPIQSRKVVFALSYQRDEYLAPLIETMLNDPKYRVKLLYPKPGILYYFKIIYTLSTAQVIVIDKEYKYLYGVVPRKGSMVIQAWHAGGLFKKFALDIPLTNGPGLLKSKIRQHSSYSAVFCSAESLRADYARAFNKPIEKVYALGAVKTDPLYAAKQQQCLHKQEFYQLFPEAKNKQIVLYAPTFRNSQKDLLKIKPETRFVPAINGESFFQACGQKYFLAFRAHFHHRYSYSLDNFYANVTDMPLASLLAVTDVLITDYSSIFFDFLIFKKPIIFFPYDKYTYEESRGLYEPYETFVPGSICLTEGEIFNELMSSRQAAWNQTFWDKYMGACDGQVCAKVVSFIDSQLGAKN